MVNYLDVAGLTDEELVARTLKNQDYFSFLMKRYSSKLISYIIRLSGISHEDAEDLLQEIFIKTYRHLNDFDPNLKFSSWLYRIAHNHIISHFRKNKIKTKATINLDEEGIANIASDFNLNQEMDGRLNRQLIEDILNCLPADDREILVLKFLEERDYREISDILQKPMGTVATLISRAKAKFKAEIKTRNINL